MSPLSKAARAQSPDARPSVSVAQLPLSEPGAVAFWEARCSTGSCDWVYGPSLKTDVAWHATMHRAHHRRQAAQRAD